MKNILLLPLLTLILSSCNVNQKHEIISPWGNAKLTVDCRDQLSYSVTFNDVQVILPSAFMIELEGIGALKDFEIIGVDTRLINKSWGPVWGKNSNVRDHCMEHLIRLEERNNKVLVDLEVRAYSDGVAFRYGFPEQDKLERIAILDEEIRFRFNGDFRTWMTSYDHYVSSQEQEFPEIKLSEAPAEKYIGLPLLVEVDEEAWCVLAEANLTDWAGAFLRVDQDSRFTLKSYLAPHPDQPEIKVKRTAPAWSPWKVIMLADKPGGLIESNIIANLNDSCRVEDVSWISPGVSAWDWWWSNRYAPSVDFELGPNQQTMKYFIDFASEMGWEYQIVDWQWYGEPFADPTMTAFDAHPDADITTSIDGIDIPSLVEYAAERDVRIIVWLHWEHLRDQMDKALPLYEDWGVAGIKVDFMDRQDQEIVRFYHDVARKAAEHHLVVDFHGAYRPTGVSRTYPNLITREGVLGNEYTKWSDRITPEHNVTLPFTRGLLGEMDFTPAAFRNVTPEDFQFETDTPDGSPVVQTTRCHQLAMTVVYESAFGVFCDSPDNYAKGIGLDLLKTVPTTWDETKVINAAVADFITIARRSGKDWFVGSMTDGDPRELDIHLWFLDEDETYLATTWQDAADADQHPMNAERVQTEVKKGDVLNAMLAAGGGQVTWLQKQ